MKELSLNILDITENSVKAGATLTQISIEEIDDKIVSVVKKALNDSGEPYRILLLPDHPTPISKRTHTSDPVPYILFDSEATTKNTIPFNEKAAALSGVFVENGYQLLDMLIK